MSSTDGLATAGTAVTLKDGRRLSALAGLVALALVLFGWAAPRAHAAVDPNHVTFTLEGCRLAAGDTLPDTMGKFVCPDADYTTGNLGKFWNELDLVPHRITAANGNGQQTYAVVIAADNLKGGAPGYDVISVPEVNTSLSTNSGVGCAVVADNQKTQSPGVGGADATIYRTLTITQAPGSTCVFDYYERLALGSHLYSGSSLHSNLLNQQLGSAGIGSKDVSIPVKEIQPQGLSKTMSATQGSSTVWNVTKESSPNHLNFDTCSGGQDALAQGVTITVSWTKITTAADKVTIVTNITVTNPAHRTITATVNDQVYEGAGQSTLADEYTFPATDVAPDSEKVLTHTYTVDAAGATQYNDLATAHYTDKDTGITVPGTTTATALADVQTVSDPNSSASITDTEQITGDGLTFSVDSLDGDNLPSDSFDPAYTLGTPTTGPVTWKSGTVTSSGHVTFNKTVYVDQARTTSGELSDTATLTDAVGTDPAPTATGSTIIDASSCVQGRKFLDVNGNGVDDNEPGLAGVTIYVDVNGNGTLDPEEQQYSAVTGADGSYSIGTASLAAGTYTLTEVVPAGYTCSYPKDTCSYSVVVGDGAAITGKDFGNFQNATVSGRKYEDLNGNGTHDDGEPYLNGWRVYVDLNGNGSYDAGEPTDVTHTVGENDGSYVIDDVPPGTDAVDVREAVTDAAAHAGANWSCSEPGNASGQGQTDCYVSHTFHSGDQFSQDFGNYRDVTVSGRKYEDLNANGQHDSGEPYLGGWRIYADLNGNGTFDEGEPSDVTSGSGDYSFSVKPDGQSYKIREQVTDAAEYAGANWSCSEPDNASGQGQTDCYVSAEFTSGADISQQFGNYRKATITGRKFADLNANGQHDGGEPYLNGWTVFADLNGNGVLDEGEPSDVTAGDGDATGTYSLTLTPSADAVKIREVQQDGWTCTAPTTTDAHGCVHTFTPTSGVTETGDFGNHRPIALDLNKKVRIGSSGDYVEGPLSALVGDTVGYQVSVTNTGHAPLTLTWGDQLSSSFVDAKCDSGTIAGPDTGADDTPSSFDPGDVWTFTCTHVVTSTDASPIVNTVKVTGTDEFGATATDQDSTSVAILKPAVAIEKTGPATANAGDLVPYTLNITNPGNVAYADPLVVVSDPLCQAPPALVSKNGDATPATFDPGDRWTYTCSVQTVAGQTEVPNVATVQATDRTGASATAQAPYTTLLTQPQVQVLPETVTKVTPGSAKLRGPTGCPTSAATKATVTGKRITKVTFYVDGKKFKTVTRPDSKGRWSVTLKPKTLPYGSHRVRATIQFATDSGTKAKNLSLTFNRCRPAIVKPKFTG